MLKSGSSGLVSCEELLLLDVVESLLDVESSLDEELLEELEVEELLLLDDELDVEVELEELLLLLEESFVLELEILEELLIALEDELLLDEELEVEELLEELEVGVELEELL